MRNRSFPHAAQGGRSGEAGALAIIIWVAIRHASSNSSREWSECRVETPPKGRYFRGALRSTT